MIIRPGSVSEKASTTMGIRMPKVPQLVPVAKARPQPTRKITAGSRLTIAPVLWRTRASTNTSAPRLSVMAFRVQAKVRIRMAGTIALKPSGRHSMQALKFSTRRTA